MLKPKKQQDQHSQQPSQKQDEQHQHQQSDTSKPEVPPKLPPTHPLTTGQHPDQQTAVPLAGTGAGAGAAAPDAGSSSIANAVDAQYHKSADDNENNNKAPVSPVGPTPISKDNRTVSEPVSAMSADEEKPLPVPKTETAAPVIVEKTETTGMHAIPLPIHVRPERANTISNSSPPLANFSPGLPTRHQREHQAQRYRPFHSRRRRCRSTDNRSPTTSQSLLRIKPRRRRRRENARHGGRAAGDQGQSRRPGHERDFGPARRFPSRRRQALGWFAAFGVIAQPLGTGLMELSRTCLQMHFRTSLKYGECESGGGGWTAKKTVEHEDYTPPIEFVVVVCVEFFRA